MNQPGNSPDHQPRYRIPAVPPDYAEQKQSKLAVVGFSLAPLLVLTLCVVLIWQGIRGISFVTAYTAVTPTPTPSIAVTPTPTPSIADVPPLPTDINCPLTPKQAAKDDKSPPALAFCFPLYQGNVAGPVGTRIILVGGNFAADKAKWWLTEEGIDPQTACLTKEHKGCISLPAPPKVKKNPDGTVLFSWTWDKPFLGETGKSYNISAQINDQQLVKSSLAFTVLASAPPCIAISAPEAKFDNTCTNNPPFHTHKGAKLMLHGSNWLLGWLKQPPTDIKISIGAKCIRDAEDTCHGSKLFYIEIPNTQLKRDGTFDQLITLPQDKVGRFEIHATSQTATNVPEGKSDIVTVADRALTFGYTQNVKPLILDVQ